ncbi:MAG: ferrous iron transport protein B [Prevotellaceae bacterium]|jgi:ferrous iron transport protein B|nr:ferrous iron transport protein B [Prevotellaceae bacterium]
MTCDLQLLSDLKTGDEAIIVKVLGHGAFRKRITEMGFVKGKKVTVIKNAPLQDPVEYEIMGYKISLRRSEAELVVTVPPEGRENNNPNIEDRQLTHQPLSNDKCASQSSSSEGGGAINIALVGNPNSGKTSLFNHASGSREHVGNYSGVTVDAKEASMKFGGYTFLISDLPGTYSITEYSPEELYVRRHIFEKMPDIVVNVVDASNLERNLFLTTQLIDMNVKVVIALNMYDELEGKGAKFDYKALSEMIGIPIIPTVASRGKGIDELFSKLIDVYEDRDPIMRHIHINYGTLIEKSIAALQNEIWKNPQITDKYSSRYLAIKLLETDKTTLNFLEKCDNFQKIKYVAEREIAILEKEYAEKSETIITDAKYGFIEGALKETYHPAQEKKDSRRVRELDDILTHRIWGFPVFLFFLWLMFQTTFTLGSYPMGWIESGVQALGSWVSSLMGDGALRDLLVEGVIAGVGGVIVFLPNILILFFFISLMEDTGYMARAAFMMDKLMHKIGLHGKSFIPLVMGFGCNVPAVMATRTLENRKDRILTMLIVPFMSCSARLPVYVLIVSAFFAKNQGLVLFSVYLAGIVLAVLVALVLKKFAFAGQDVPFVMELPPYRIPTMRNTSLHTWHKGQQYLKKMGTVILVASVLIWALGYFPRERTGQTEGEMQAQSYIGQLGQVIEPVIAPLGFDWKMGVSIISGLAAKEIVVSTMSVLYQADSESHEASASLVEKLQRQETFTPLVAYGFMLFILIYFPCVAVIAAIRKEAGWRWAVFSMVYTTALAWVVAFLLYQVGSLL